MLIWCVERRGAGVKGAGLRTTMPATALNSTPLVRVCTEGDGKYTRVVWCVLRRVGDGLVSVHQRVEEMDEKRGCGELLEKANKKP